MTEGQTMIRTEVRIDGESYFLAQGHDLDHLKASIVARAQAAPAFVDFVVVGNRSVSVLVSARSRIVFTVETVQFDNRDTGDETEPYGGIFDL